MMKIMVAMGAVAVLLLGLTASASAAAVWSDPVESFATVSGDRDSKGGGSEEAPWVTSSPGLNLLVASGMIADGWYATTEGWNGSQHTLAQDTAMKSQGTSSMSVDTGSGDYRDIFLGRKITGLTPGNLYTFSVDLRLDPNLLTENKPPGAQTGDDHQTSASWQIRNTVENTLETMSLGLMTNDAFDDTEDYPGHERNSIWIGDTAYWDNDWHTHSLDFTAEGTEAAFVIKVRVHERQASATFGIDNLVVTPEPTSMVLLLGSLLCLRRRSR